MLLNPHRFGIGTFNPAALYNGGYSGLFVDLSDAATLFSDTGRSTPASVDGAVLGITDLSGSGIHLSTSGSSIIMKTGYLDFPGTVDGLTGSGANLVGTDGWTSCIAWKPSNIGSNRCALSSDKGGTSNRICKYSASGTSGQLAALNYHSSSSLTLISANSLIAANQNIVTSNIMTTTAGRIRLDGTEVSSSSGSFTMKTGVSAAICLGSDWLGGTGAPNLSRMQGRIYAALVINRVLTGGELSSLEAWMSGKLL